jgi:hypothetical protein
MAQSVAVADGIGPGGPPGLVWDWSAAGLGAVYALPGAIVISSDRSAAVAGAGATHRSRWYVTPAFTTYLVFMLMLYSRPQDAASRFSERLLETALGVGIAYAIGLGLPALAQRYRASRLHQPR